MVSLKCVCRRSHRLVVVIQVTLLPLRHGKSSLKIRLWNVVSDLLLVKIILYL